MNKPIHQSPMIARRDSAVAPSALNVLHGRAFDAPGLLADAVIAAPPQHRGKLLVLAVAFATGLYAGALLFSGHRYEPPAVVVCPAPGAPPAALVAAECGPQGVHR